MIVFFKEEKKSNIVTDNKANTATYGCDNNHNYDVTAVIELLKNGYIKIN